MRQVSLAHIEYLTDNFGIWQHTHGKEIYIPEGYALDDAARALIVAGLYNRPDLAAIYLGFIEKACQPDQVINFFDAQGNSQNLPWSPDALGETYWALTHCREKLPQFLPQINEIIQARILPHLPRTLEHYRATSYVVLAACKDNPAAVASLVEPLYSAFKKNATPDWPWLEQALFYGNAIIPLALIEAGELLKNTNYSEAGLTMLAFLNQACQEQGVPSMIGSNGWWFKGKERARYAQQPIEACYLMLANNAAFAATHDDNWRHMSEHFFTWYWGNNPLKAPMVFDDDSCSDGLDEWGASQNRGAESTICLLIAQASRPTVNE